MEKTQNVGTKSAFMPTINAKPGPTHLSTHLIYVKLKRINTKPGPPHLSTHLIYNIYSKHHPPTLYTINAKTTHLTYNKRKTETHPPLNTPCVCLDRNYPTSAF